VNESVEKSIWLCKNIETRHNEEGGDFQRSSNIVRAVNCRTCVENRETINRLLFLISNFRRVLYVVCFLLGNSPAFVTSVEKSVKTAFVGRPKRKFENNVKMNFKKINCDEFGGGGGSTT
jgi:hypothetical protein